MATREEAQARAKNSIYERTTSPKEKNAVDYIIKNAKNANDAKRMINNFKKDGIIKFGSNQGDGYSHAYNSNEFFNTVKNRMKFTNQTFGGNKKPKSKPNSKPNRNSGK